MHSRKRRMAEITKVVKQREFTVCLDKGIGDPAKYRELYYLLRVIAKEDDLVRIKINTGGGNVDAAIQMGAKIVSIDLD